MEAEVTEEALRRLVEAVNDSKTEGLIDDAAVLTAFEVLRRKANWFQEEVSREIRGSLADVKAPWDLNRLRWAAHAIINEDDFNLTYAYEASNGRHFSIVYARALFGARKCTANSREFGSRRRHSPF